MPLGGTNFLAWQRAVYVSLGTKMKLGFIDGTLPCPTVGLIHYEQWRRVDLTVISWIWNSMSKDIVEAFMYYATSRKLWIAIQRRCGGCTCGKNEAIAGSTASTQLVQFLRGLHESCNSGRSQILMLDPLPDIEQAFSMVYAVEKQRAVQAKMTEISSHMACHLNLKDNRRDEDKHVLKKNRL
ncbi:UNVERIFIED_CONTAM: hypothetical protein Sangu_2844800 [Sesamum angustifolium]|uniref:Retrotransposon Copia-like N-terminal domain-containing protein n=1 Tax=Sesamum angustifolium TaxID=2727405 RepID=A0AAW2IPT7_9LAMI